MEPPEKSGPWKSLPKTNHKMTFSLLKMGWFWQVRNLLRPHGVYWKGAFAVSFRECRCLGDLWGDEILPSDEGMIKISIITIPINKQYFLWLKRMVMRKGTQLKGDPVWDQMRGVFLVFLYIVWVGNLMNPDKRTGIMVTNAPVISTSDSTFSWWISIVQSIR